MTAGRRKVKTLDDVAEMKATTSSAGLPLNDEDSTMVLEDGWKKVNTLRHYGVRDGTTLLLVTKQPVGNDSVHSVEDGDDDEEGIVSNVHG